MYIIYNRSNRKGTANKSDFFVLLCISIIDWLFKTTVKRKTWKLRLNGIVEKILYDIVHIFFIKQYLQKSHSKHFHVYHFFNVMVTRRLIIQNAGKAKPFSFVCLKIWVNLEQKPTQPSETPYCDFELKIGAQYTVV